MDPLEAIVMTRGFMLDLTGVGDGVPSFFGTAAALLRDGKTLAKNIVRAVGERMNERFAREGSHTVVFDDGLKQLEVIVLTDDNIVYTYALQDYEGWYVMERGSHGTYERRVSTTQILDRIDQAIAVTLRASSTA